MKYFPSKKVESQSHSEGLGILIQRFIDDMNRALSGDERYVYKLMFQLYNTPIDYDIKKSVFDTYGNFFAKNGWKEFHRAEKSGYNIAYKILRKMYESKIRMLGHRDGIEVPYLYSYFTKGIASYILAKNHAKLKELGDKLVRIKSKVYELWIIPSYETADILGGQLDKSRLELIKYLKQNFGTGITIYDSYNDKSLDLTGKIKWEDFKTPKKLVELAKRVEKGEKLDINF